MSLRHHPYNVCPELQADATLTQVPVSGTEYPVLTTKRYVRIIDAECKVTWTVQPTPLELHFTIDGRVVTFTVANPISATPYAARYRHADGGNGVLIILNTNALSGFIIEGRSIAITAEITGGTVQNLSSRVKYAQW